MGKKYHNLYARVYDPVNLWLSFKQAARGKRSHPAVAAFEYYLEKELIQLEDELCHQTYVPGPYHNFEIQRPKRRLISAAPFRDRVVHHALMNVIEPLFERQFIFDSYANRVGKGTHRALNRCTYYMRRHRYVMHCDIVQFFPSIDHQILRSILQRTICDEKALLLIDKLLASGAAVNSQEFDLLYFPGDDLFAAYRARGLPIGNLTSQHWANVYLNELDQFAKRQLKCKAYIRYVDDILLFSDEKAILTEWRFGILSYLNDLRLKMHENCAQPRPVRCGQPYLGFIIFPDHRRLKRRNGVAFLRRLKAQVNAYHNGEIDSQKLNNSLQGWINHARYGDTWGLRRSILEAAGLGMTGYG